MQSRFDAGQVTLSCPLAQKKMILENVFLANTPFSDNFSLITAPFGTNIKQRTPVSL